MRTDSKSRDLSLYGGKDPRELPIYSADEAAHILCLPPATIKAWTNGKVSGTKPRKHGSDDRMIIPPASPERLLSFVNLIEAHILQAIRRSLRLRTSKLRDTMRALRKNFGEEHPLLAFDSSGEGPNALFEFARLMELSHDQQIEMQRVVSIYLRRIDRERGKPLRLYPFFYEPRIEGPACQDQPRLVSVNPFVAFGRPTVAGTNIHTEAIADLFFAGESVEELARDYGLETSFIEAAVRFEGTRLTGKAAA